MTNKKYDLSLRNFNDNIINIILKKSLYTNIEEYEFETDNPKFNFFINTTTNHVYYAQNNINFNNHNDKYLFFFVPISYLTNETKEYFFKKYFIKNGYSNFDEYFITYSYTMPCIYIYILKKQYLENKHDNESNTTINSDNKVSSIVNDNNLFDNYIDNQKICNLDNNLVFDNENNEMRNEPQPSINYKNFYCQIVKKKLLVRAYNLELDYSIRQNDYLYNTWNIFNTTIKYNKHFKAWVFPLVYKKRLMDLGVIFVCV